MYGLPAANAMGRCHLGRNCTADDVRLHHLVLDDGTDIGDVMPGQMTAPIDVNTDVPGMFHSTLHPSMVGSINGDPLMFAPPAPPDGGMEESPIMPPYDGY